MAVYLIAEIKVTDDKQEDPISGQLFNLDVDGDEKVTAFSDGLMVIRRLFGTAFQGASLTDKAISPDSPYYGQEDAALMVAQNIDALNTFI